MLTAVAIPGFAGEAENVAIVEKMTKAINERDFDALVAKDLLRHSAATPQVNVTSLDEFKAFLHADLAACPDAMQEKVAEIWVEWDNLGALAQLGHFPPKPGGEPEKK